MLPSISRYPSAGYYKNPLSAFMITTPHPPIPDAYINRRSPSIAVIIPTYNRAKLVSLTVDSVLGQTRPPDQIIVVDDGSTDDTEAVIAAKRADINYVRVENSGKSHALNVALPRIVTDLVCIFDDDDLMMPNALEVHERHLRENPHVDFTYSDHYAFSGNKNVDEAARDGRRVSLELVPAERFLLWTMEKPFLPVHMQGMLIPARCYARVGPFDPELPRCQDHDMVCRIARHFRAGHIRQPLWAFRQHDGARGPAAETHSAQDRYRVWRKYKQQVFNKIYATLALPEYLPKACAGNDEDSIALQRQALLSRARIMSIHGLYANAQNDVAAYRHLVDVGASPSRQERIQISQLLLIPNTEFRASNRYYRALGKLMRSNSALIGAAMKGFYWWCAREIRNRQWRSFASATLASQAFLSGALISGKPGNGS